MNAKLRCKPNQQMTVNSLSPLNQHQSADKLCYNSSKLVFNTKIDRHSVGLFPLKNQKHILPVESRSVLKTDRSDPSSSIILRQKLLHRNKNGSIVGSSPVAKSGRKSYSRSQNNGFKFHNFVVNEDKRSCLEEQDGTKKITVSHWKRPNTSQTPVNEESHEICSNSSPSSHSILETLLAPNVSNTQTPEDQQRVNKRKPLHVRRVLRQQPNQSMSKTEPQPQDEPLDLSFKRIDFDLDSVKTESPESDSGLVLFNTNLMNYNTSNGNDFLNSESPTESESVQHLIKSVNRSAAQASAIISSVKCSNSANFSSNPSDNSSIAQKQIDINCGISAKQHKLRQTHRSLIKKQLEETFKQNGFLVKTKQVSDANNSAMFCKFRQLRKYTRYYLKSWHHHLPDEVNKLWKGFLPPKTEKPNSSHN